ncbi:hypothetical protein [Nonomuraea sp. NEAU-A123]|uniref:hypothetical protein n=1 Tax=Nonomuraea sp. NEAU-A123 TaxID=2839649 RepID=UPI001BE3E753|nr:hypothetical protein [Nonomuraea sp. NEAU-A123]MBT2226766.1 hypothetical protein [Nonomuraea sp. NEAU-A123]
MAFSEKGPTPAFLHLYVDGADAVHRRAVAAGSTSVSDGPPEERAGRAVSRGVPGIHYAGAC